MNYEFKNDVNIWFYDYHKRTELPKNTIIVPTSKQIYFESKLYEIYLRYQSARLMFTPIDNNKNDYWYDSFDGDDVVRLNYNGFFLENAILNYNIVVDLTWVITCLSLETDYKGKKFVFDNTNEIKNTERIIRNIEKIVDSPTSKNGTKYLNKLKSKNPEYNKICSHISEFWRVFKEREIRQDYNFIKHRGKPEYKEIYKLTGKKFFTFKSNHIEYATDISDVRKEFEMYKVINSLLDFDDNILFPYCDKLFKLLLDIVYKF